METHVGDAMPYLLEVISVVMVFCCARDIPNVMLSVPSIIFFVNVFILFSMLPACYLIHLLLPPP